MSGPHPQRRVTVMAWHEPFEAPQTAPAQPPVLAVDTVVLLADGLTFPWRVGTWDVIEDDTGRSAIVLLRPLNGPTAADPEPR